MSKMKEIYRSKVHDKEKSHDVIIVQEDRKVRGSKFKMTYECYNANERFTGEHYVGGKWEHIFSQIDLGIVPDKTMYVSNPINKLERANSLIKLGNDFLIIMTND